MANWNLAEKQIYKLLKHPFQKEKSDIEAITAAYLEFVEELFGYLNKENDNKTRIRQLNMSYIDFGTIKALEETSPTENSKLKIIYLDKLLSLINMEQELIYRQMEYPKFFINIESDWKSPFYLNSEVIKIIDIMELVCGIFYIKNGIIRIDNKDIFLSDISRIFEKMFNISFGDIYAKHCKSAKKNLVRWRFYAKHCKSAKKNLVRWRFSLHLFRSTFWNTGSGHIPHFFASYGKTKTPDSV